MPIIDDERSSDNLNRDRSYLLRFVVLLRAGPVRQGKDLAWQYPQTSLRALRSHLICDPMSNVPGVLRLVTLLTFKRLHVSQDTLRRVEYEASIFVSRQSRVYRFKSEFAQYMQD
jgi:hypothetical protein